MAPKSKTLPKKATKPSTTMTKAKTAKTKTKIPNSPKAPYSPKSATAASSKPKSKSTSSNALTRSRSKSPRSPRSAPNKKPTLDSYMNRMESQIHQDYAIILSSSPEHKLLKVTCFHIFQTFKLQ